MKRRINISRIAIFLVYNLILGCILAPFIVFWGPFQDLKAMAVGTIATSRHPQVVEAFLSPDEIKEIMNWSQNQGISSGGQIYTGSRFTDAEGITIEEVEGKGFRGIVMLIEDPKRVKLAVTKEIGIAGQRVSDLVAETGAIAGINAGGFYDPNGKGNGAFPDGITVQNGRIVHNNVGNQKTHIVGLNKEGKLIAEDMTAEQVLEKQIMEAVTFYPVLIRDGKPLIKGDGGWGIGPRTGIGQKADGTIIMVVIDGRQPTWSIGAKLSDLMDVFMKYHAIIAVNLDGGSSTTMVFRDKIINKVCGFFGERYIPTAFVVMPKE
ncbi:MAG: phosphodiester glycosidase family protein [Peptococcaceae bacterium]|nr:phosphodiester glycosidase family protein [Peptococcaceae bacterium]